MFFGDFGCVSTEQLHALESIGVHILRRKNNWVPKYRGAVDLLAVEFFENLSWNSLLWIDADTLVLGDLSEVFAFEHDYVGIAPPPAGGRSQYDKNGKPNFALGFWLCRSNSLLSQFHKWLRDNKGRIRSESPACSQMITNSGCAYKQLDIDVYSFGRDAIEDARYDGQRVYYEGSHGRLYPRLAHFSRAGARRISSDALNQWYKENIDGLA